MSRHPVAFVRLLAAVGLCLPAACGAPSGAHFPVPAPSNSRLSEAWNPANDPLRLGAGFERRFDALPLLGSLSRLPWAESYWPSYHGGISHRWLANDARDFKYAPPSKELLSRMSMREKAELSPAEKYDAYLGDYSYPLVASERRRVSPDDASWEGLCHGWAPAALAFREPDSVLAVNPDGIEIPFGSSDLKALLLYVQGEVEAPAARMLGSRCNAPAGSSDPVLADPACRDVNAGSFHVALANLVGLSRKGFVFDVQRDAEVWNQPVYGYESVVKGARPPSPGAAPAAVKEILVESRVRYVNEIASRWLAMGEQSASQLSEAVYSYALEIDARGAIVGGEWEGWRRPDFLWMQEAAHLRGRFAGLARLQALSLEGDGPFPEPLPENGPNPPPAP